MKKEAHDRFSRITKIMLKPDAAFLTGALLGALAPVAVPLAATALIGYRLCRHGLGPLLDLATPKPEPEDAGEATAIDN